MSRIKKAVQVIFSIIGVRWTNGDDLTDDKGIVISQLNNQSASGRSTMNTNQSIISWFNWKVLTRKQIIDDFVYATITTPVSVVISSNPAPALIVEQGTIITWITATVFNPGAFTNGDLSAGPNVVGDATQFEFTNPDGTTSVEAASANTHAYTAPAYAIGIEDITMAVEVTYPALALTSLDDYYYNSDGTTGYLLDPQRVAGTLTDAITETVTGYAYAFWGTGATPTLTAQVRAQSKQFLNSSSDGTFDMTIPITPVVLVWFAVPTGKTPIVTFVESGNIYITSEFSLAGTVAVATGEGAGATVTYDIYESVIPGIGYEEESTYKVTIS